MSITRRVGYSLLLLVSLPPAVRAQAAEGDRQAVLAVVHRLFAGMRNGDSAAVRGVFHPGALLATALVREGGGEVRIDSLGAFVRAVGAPHEEPWDERLRSAEVRIDGALASVWAEYAFYLGKKFSHCGVDAFQLARQGDGWRIIALTDTRRQEGCRETEAP